MSDSQALAGQANAVAKLTRFTGLSRQRQRRGIFAPLVVRTPICR